MADISAQSPEKTIEPGGDPGTAGTDHIPPPSAKPPGGNGLNIDYGFLNSDGLNNLRGLVDAKTAPSQMPSNMRLLPGDVDWAEKSIPLPLCEFLAYKSALAYSSAADIEKNLKDSCIGISKFKFFDTSLSSVEDTQGYGFLFDGRVFIVMRGTESDKDWAGNRDDKFTTPPWNEKLSTLVNKKNAKFHTPGQHRGFANAWAAVRAQIENWLLHDLPKVKPGEKRSYVFSGHSLGGALAVIGAYEFQNYYPDRDVSAVVTFGAPMVGNKEFAEQYRASLGARTVRLESDGDIVPRIMGSWYFRLHQRARKWIEAQMDKKVSPKQGEFYQAVGEKWGFAETPLLARSEFDAVLSVAAQRLAEAAQRQVKKMAEENKSMFDDDPFFNKKDDESVTGNSSAEETPGDTKADTSSNEMSQQSGAKSTGTSKGDKSGGSDSTVVYWVIGAVVVVVVGGLVLWHVKRKFGKSHDIQQRYALYLSALSYQRLRDVHGGDVERANEDLDRHLKFIRGAVEAEPEKKHVFGQVARLPLRFSKDDDLDTFGRESSSYVF